MHMQGDLHIFTKHGKCWSGVGLPISKPHINSLLSCNMLMNLIASAEEGIARLLRKGSADSVLCKLGADNGGDVYRK